MNAINGRVHILDRDTQSDLADLALVRQQEAFIAALAADLMEISNRIERRGDAPICWPTQGHDLATTLAMLRRDLMPDGLAADVTGAEEQFVTRGV